MAGKWKNIYEDDAIIVCDKSAGVAVQSRRLNRQDLEGLVRSYLIRQSGKRDVFVAAVHRLDQPVEGLVLLAKTRQAAGVLSRQMQEGEWSKEYLAVVEGKLPQTEGILEDYLRKDARTQQAQVVSAQEEGAKRAELEYKVLESLGDRQLVKIWLHTGRYHQIRAQFAHAGHPLAGDNRYQSASGTDGRGLGLCAYRLAFDHPVTGERLTFTKCPEGEKFRDFTYICKMCAQ